MSKKEQDGSEKIIKYLTQTNRPYSVNDIFLNLHKEIGKTAVQKILEQLAESGSVKEKTYGKQKVYVIDQSKFPALDEAKLREMDSTTTQLTESIKEKSKSTAQLETKLKTLQITLTDDQIQLKLEQITTEISQLETKLSNLQENRVFVSEQDREKILFQREKAMKEWRKRKRMTNDILNAILEDCPKSKKELYDEIGIETDEDVGVVIPKT